MPIILDGTAGIDNDATDLSYTGTLTGGTGVVNLGSGQFYKGASGNVGIGTDAPDSPLQVGTASPIRFLNQITTAPTNLSGPVIASTDSAVSGANGDLLLAPRTNAARSIVFFSGNGTSSERARIDSSGNLLVGTTTVGGAGGGISICPNLTNGTGRIIFDRDSTAASAIALEFENADTTVGSITYTNTTTTYNTSSDYRLKHDIQPMTGALAKVAALKPCTYKWNADDSAGEGFIAHELQAVVPDCVTGEKDAVDADGNPQYQGIDTSFLVATLTAAIQEQQAIIESLTARVVALEQP